MVRCIICGGTAASKRYEGPTEADGPEKKDEIRGIMKRRKRGRNCRKMSHADGIGSDCVLVSRVGLLRGRAPPN